MTAGLFWGGKLCRLHSGFILKRLLVNLHGVMSRWKDVCWLLWRHVQFLPVAQPGCCLHMRCSQQYCSRTGWAPGTRFQAGPWATGCSGSLLLDHLGAEKQSPQAMRRAWKDLKKKKRTKQQVTRFAICKIFLHVGINSLWNTKPHSLYALTLWEANIANKMVS